MVFDHASPSSLEALLNRQRSAGDRAWIVTESLFSMDGDAAPLPAFARLAAQHDAQLFVDEAHAIGVCGPGGRGLCAAQGVTPEVLIGTLGKSLGSQGAFVAGSERLIAFLWNRARSFVFSTGLSPILAQTALRNLSLLKDDGLRAHLRQLSERLSAGVAQGAWEHRTGPGAIHSLLLGDPAAALAKAQATLEHGILVRAIRPPTVPKGTSRLRVVLSAFHTTDHVDRLLRALQ
ncbi:MAG: aminotransferase class I/II-fold pyridoxal phosphate-dependent enzyme [Myxococcota bacterium]